MYSLTSYGPFVVRMDRSNAPCGVDNFVHLTKSRFYDWTPYFRLTNSARLGVLQCCDIYRQEEGGRGTSSRTRSPARRLTRAVRLLWATKDPGDQRQ